MIRAVDDEFVLKFQQYLIDINPKWGRIRTKEEIFKIFGWINGYQYFIHDQIKFDSKLISFCMHIECQWMTDGVGGMTHDYILFGFPSEIRFEAVAIPVNQEYYNNFDGVKNVI